jgi:hypothetical protein
MKISVIYFGDREKLVSSMFLSLYFDISYLNAREVNPMTLAGSSVIVIDSDGFVEGDVVELEARWHSIEPYPVAVLTENPGVEHGGLNMALKISDRLFKSDGLPNIVAQIRSLGSASYEQATPFGLMPKKHV